MNTFRNKQFKNELDPKYAFYDCLRSCEIKNSSAKSLEECVDSCNTTSSSKFSNNQKKKGAYQAPNENSKRDSLRKSLTIFDR